MHATSHSSLCFWPKLTSLIHRHQTFSSWVPSVLTRLLRKPSRNMQSQEGDQVALACLGYSPTLRPTKGGPKQWLNMWQQHGIWLICCQKNENGTRHKELCPTEIGRSDKSVAKVTTAVNSFLDPFEVEDVEKLYCISSGAPVPENIARDIL